MRKFLRPMLIGLGGFLLGTAVLLGFLKASPETSRSLLGLEAPRGESKAIVPALQLPQRQEEEEQAVIPSPAPPVAKGARRAPNFPSLFDDEDDGFFGQDPFVAMRKMQEDMEKQMRAGFGGASGAVRQQITRKEDAKSVSYEIQGIDNASLNTHVENGYLTITAETRSEGKGSFHQSMITQSVPLPPDVDPNKMETLSGKDSVTLRFPKRNS